MQSQGRNAGRPTSIDEGGEQPVESIAGSAKGGILLICDHASNRIPSALGNLGLPQAALGLHVAWDIGAAALTRALAARLDAPAILTTASRLVIDCNRAPFAAGWIPSTSHGVAIPGNVDLTPMELRRRQSTYFDPYHDAIAAQLLAMDGTGTLAALVSIHSFTPVLADMQRPWHVGILSDRDRRLADFFLAALGAESGLALGDNQPYSGSHPQGYSCRHHGDAQGRPNVLIEVRQDLLGDEIAVAAWCERLGNVLTAARRGGFGTGAVDMTPPVQAA